MTKTLKDRLIELKQDREVRFINFFNDGSISSDDYNFAKLRSKLDSVETISETFFRAAQSYSYDRDFDTITMYLLLGLVYDKNDVNEDKSLKADAKPLNNVVRFYTGSVKSYKNGEQNNRLDYYEYGVNRQGYINFDDLVKAIKKEGLEYMGPESFEEFKNLVLSKTTFDVTLTANLKQESEKVLTRRM